MTKSGKLSNVEKYCIQGMFQNGLSIDEICHELNRKESIVVAYLESLEHSLEKIEKNKDPRTKDFIINKTRSGKRGVSIMTETASQRSDEHRQQIRSKNDKLKDSIHKIYDEEN